MNVNEAMRCVSDGQSSSRDGYAVLFNLEVGTALKAEVERLRAELAAAKAASVVPVKWKSVERFFKPFLSDADLGNKWGIEFWFDTKEQRDKFGKWVKKRSEG